MKTIEKEWLPLGAFCAMITRQYAGVLVENLAHTEIERHYSVLLTIHHSGKPISQQCIADKLFIDKASMVRILDYLSGLHLLEKAVNPENRREYKISLTEKAKKIVPVIEKGIAALNKTAFKSISFEEKKTFYKVLDQVSANLKDLPSRKVAFQLKSIKKTKKLA